MIAIDASVVVKLYREEPGSDEALALIEDCAGELIAPAHFAIEVAGALVRDANTDKSSTATNREKLASFAALLTSPALRIVQTTPEAVIRAANLAIDLGHPLKDCIYLALAMEQGCELATCDARFAAKAQEVYEGLRLVG